MTARQEAPSSVTADVKLEAVVKVEGNKPRTEKSKGCVSLALWCCRCDSVTQHSPGVHKTRTGSEAKKQNNQNNNNNKKTLISTPSTSRARTRPCLKMHFLIHLFIYFLKKLRARQDDSLGKKSDTMSSWNPQWRRMTTESCPQNLTIEYAYTYIIIHRVSCAALLTLVNEVFASKIAKVFFLQNPMSTRMSLTVTLGHMTSYESSMKNVVGWAVGGHTFNPSTR